jgi:hypothetical protein
MANTTFSGAVRSENGFQSITKNATTGAVTVDATFAAATVIEDLTASGTVILSGLPTEDPGVEGQLWNNSNVLNVSAGA